MEQSLCAHCLNCGEIKYDGFFCDITGYLEDKSISEGCPNFKDDSDQFNDNIKKAKEPVITKEKWLKLYDYINDKINECINGLRDTYEQGTCLPYTHDLRGERQVLISIQTLMLNMPPTESLYGNAWGELEKAITLAADRGTPTEKRVSEHIMTKMGCIKLSIDH